MLRRFLPLLLVAASCGLTRPALAQVDQAVSQVGTAQAAQQPGMVFLCKYTTTPVTAADGAANQPQCTAVGVLKVDASGATVPVSGSVTALQTAVASTTPAACVSVTTSTTSVLASNSSRKFLSFVAKSTNTALVHFRFGATAVTTDTPLMPGQAFTVDSFAIYTGAVNAIAAAGTQLLCPVEF